MPTWYSDAIEVGPRDGSSSDASLPHVFDRQLRGRVSRAVHRLDRLLLRIVEEAEGVAVPGCSAPVFSLRCKTHPPMPQQLGSVTLSAAETATAASADRDQAQGGQVDQHSDTLGPPTLTSVTPLSEDLQPRLDRQRLRGSHHPLSAVHLRPTAWEPLEDDVRLIHLRPVDLHGGAM